MRRRPVRNNKPKGRPRGAGYPQKSKRERRADNYIPLSRKPSRITAADEVVIRRHILLLATEDDVGYYMRVLADIYDTTVEHIGDILAGITESELRSICRTRSIWERRAAARPTYAGKEGAEDG